VVPEPVVEALRMLCTSLPSELDGLLDDDERDALRRRAVRLVEHPVFPIDRSGRRYPWPLV
jgi:hypothetical protein